MIDFRTVSRPPECVECPGIFLRRMEPAVGIRQSRERRHGSARVTSAFTFPHEIQKRWTVFSGIEIACNDERIGEGLALYVMCQEFDALLLFPLPCVRQTDIGRTGGSHFRGNDDLRLVPLRRHFLQKALQSGFPLARVEL